MGWFNKFEDGSRTVYLMAQSSAGMKWKFLGGAVALVAIVAGGGFGLSRYWNAKAEQRMAYSWGALNRCLIGEPVKPKERVSVRVRAIQLTAMTQADVMRASSGGDPWPNRCARHAHELRQALVDASRAKKDVKDLAYWAEKLATLVKEEGAFHADMSEIVDQVWEQAEKEGLSASTPPDVQAPPAPAQPLTVDSMLGSEPIAKTMMDMKSLHVEVHPSTALKFLVEDKEIANSPFYCVFTGSPASARCSPVSADVASTQHGFMLLGASDEESDPLVFAGNRGADGVFRAGSGEKIDAAPSYGGYAQKDGHTFLMTYDEAARQLRVVRKPAGKAKKVSPISPEGRVKIGSPQYDAELLWNHVVFRGANPRGEVWLMGSEIQSGEPGVGPLVEIGQLSEGGVVDKGPAETPQLNACRASKALVVRSRGEKEEFLSFFIGGKWTKPVQVVGAGGTLSCRKAEAAITRVDASRTESSLDTSITMHRCTASACQTDVVKLDQLLKGQLVLAPKAGIVAGELDGKMLVVWGAAERGGVRMRLAPPDKISKAADMIVFDDFIKDGQVQRTSQMFDMRLFTREKFALLLLSTATGTHAIRIELDGKYAPVKIEWDKD